MTSMIECGIEELLLLHEERISMHSLLMDEVNPLPVIERNKAMIRLNVVMHSIDYLDSLIRHDLANVPFEWLNLDGTPTNGE